MPSKAKPPAKPAARKRAVAPRPAPLAKGAATVAATPRLRKSPEKHKSASVPAAPASTKTSKQSQLIALLRTPTGTSIEQMTTVTGWQPHTVRGVISGVLRKRLALNVACSGPDEAGIRTYRIVDAA
jgi:hypothetical protein